MQTVAEFEGFFEKKNSHTIFYTIKIVSFVRSHRILYNFLLLAIILSYYNYVLHWRASYLLISEFLRDTWLPTPFYMSSSLRLFFFRWNMVFDFYSSLFSLEIF